MTDVIRQGDSVLSGLDGSNPLAFLAAVGALRTVALARCTERVTLAWRRSGGAWRPVVESPSLTDSLLLEVLASGLSGALEHPALARWDNLNVSPEDYGAYAAEAAQAATRGDRAWSDFAAAFACETTTTTDAGKAPSVQDTALRTMSGAGHQDFVGFMRNIVADAGREHLEKALFTPWAYDDPAENHSLRWDPLDDVRHALRWRKPSGDPARKVGGTMWGASRLAIEGLPLLPSMPTGTRLETTGFSGSGRRNTFWTWPIWDHPIDVDVCRSLLALDELTSDQPDARVLRARGIATAYRSQRITEGKYRNFTPAQAVA